MASMTARSAMSSPTTIGHSLGPNSGASSDSLPSKSGASADSPRGSTASSDGQKEKRTLQERQDGIKAAREEKKMEAMGQVATAADSRLTADGLNKARAELQKSQDQFEEALGVDPKSMNFVKTTGRKVAAVNFAFLMVVCGCEIDLYGFAMAFQGYWDMNLTQGKFVVRALLIVGPVGYFLAVALYMMFYQGEKERIARENQENPEPIVNEYIVGTTDSNVPAFRVPRLKRDGIQMHFYHFLPVFRYYLVVKEREAGDIESVFRVNSLSSFSLGTPQIVSLLFSHFVAGNPLDIFMQINIVSQCVNWFITVMYFLTPVSSMMQGMIKVDAKRSKNKEWLKRRQEEWDELCKLAADKSDATAQIQKNQFICRIDNLIISLACISEDFCFDTSSLRRLDMSWKFRVIQKMFQKGDSIYALSSA